MCFTILSKEKTPVQAIKTRCSETRKIEIFLKGVVHGFGLKLAIFACFYFRQYRPEKCVSRYSRRKKRLSRLQKQKVKKVENLRFFQRGQSMVLVQNWSFLHLFILGEIGQENVFYNILEGKNTFLGYKNKKFKNVERLRFF